MVWHRTHQQRLEWRQIRGGPRQSFRFPSDRPQREGYFTRHFLSSIVLKILCWYEENTLIRIMVYGSSHLPCPRFVCRPVIHVSFTVSAKDQKSLTESKSPDSQALKRHKSSFENPMSFFGSFFGRDGSAADWKDLLTVVALFKREPAVPPVGRDADLARVDPGPAIFFFPD